ncbi:hypothetical protein DUI87_32097 [Hirundo rustica rustica]|uniref:Uncharacterized protein n=1 Tax=Hirundo rustica rustica TaxID=333673 RepID=A0A3M0ISY1_HIRRU|nr:hypothetical protein DUI87_32097 [Hirundo rustica rustica]
MVGGPQNDPLHLVWGPGNVLEHSRVQELAGAIRDSERGGKALLEIVADGEEPPEMVQEGSPEEDMVPDQSNTGAAVHAIMAPGLGIWCSANEQERQAALRAAEEVIACMVEILSQGHRTPFFKQFFSSWKWAASAHGAVPDPECDQACASSQQRLHSV